MRYKIFNSLYKDVDVKLATQAAQAVKDDGIIGIEGTTSFATPLINAVLKIAKDDFDIQCICDFSNKNLENHGYLYFIFSEDFSRDNGKSEKIYKQIDRDGQMVEG